MSTRRIYYNETESRRGLGIYSVKALNLINEHCWQSRSLSYTKFKIQDDNEVVLIDNSNQSMRSVFRGLLLRLQSSIRVARETAQRTIDPNYAKEQLKAAEELTSLLKLLKAKDDKELKKILDSDEIAKELYGMKLDPFAASVVGVLEKMSDGNQVNATDAIENARKRILKQRDTNQAVLDDLLLKARAGANVEIPSLKMFEEEEL